MQRILTISSTFAIVATFGILTGSVILPVYGHPGVGEHIHVENEVLYIIDVKDISERIVNQSLSELESGNVSGAAQILNNSLGLFSSTDSDIGLASSVE